MLAEQLRDGLGREAEAEALLAVVTSLHEPVATPRVDGKAHEMQAGLQSLLEALRDTGDAAAVEASSCVESVVQELLTIEGKLREKKRTARDLALKLRNSRREREAEEVERMVCYEGAFRVPYVFT